MSNTTVYFHDDGRDVRKDKYAKGQERKVATLNNVGRVYGFTNPRM